MDSQDVRSDWAERSGEFSPTYYAHRGPDERSRAVRRAVAEHAGEDPAVMEVGSGVGRHLAHLHDDGVTDLTGVEVNADALDVMAAEYPDLAAAGTFHAAAIEDVVEEFGDGAFDAVFSVETLQHVHPESAWVFAELARAASDLVVTVENEGDLTGKQWVATPETAAARAADPAVHGVNYVNDEFPLYYRDWNAVFTGLGWTEVERRVGDRDTLRVFRPSDGGADHNG